MDDFEKDFYNQITEAINESFDEISKGLEDKVEENTQARKESGFKDR